MEGLGSDGSGGELDNADLEPSDIEVLRTLCSAAATPAPASMRSCRGLDDPPSTITDKFSNVLGDGFHMLDRPKVGVHHPFKKAYFNALMNAYYDWDPIMLEEAKAALRASGKSDADIEQMMYFQPSWFCGCVRRRVLPPSKLYWRLRIVFAIYGNKVNPKDNVPLFNDEAWKKANNVLQEVLAGNCSDPPNVDFYCQKLDVNGAPATNNLGLPLLESWRGTSLTECAHKQVIDSFGSWHTGVEMSDGLLAWWRHVYNQSISEHRRAGFPKIGHNYTWFIDKIQLLVEQNHAGRAYPHWSNESDYERTPEKFGTVPLHSEQLGNRVAAIDDSKLIAMDLTRNEKYIAKAMGVKVPFLPVCGDAEKRLFSRLVSNSATAVLDFDEMALEWCDYVDGKTIFPKLPAYLRTYETTWKRNQAARTAVEAAKPGTDLMKQLMARTTCESESVPQTSTPTAVTPTGPGPAPLRAAGVPGMPCLPRPTRAPIAQYQPMPQPAVVFLPSNSESTTRVVGGIVTSAVAFSEGGAAPTVGKRRHGDRGKDMSKRMSRLCARCNVYVRSKDEHGEGKCG